MNNEQLCRFFRLFLKNNINLPKIYKKFLISHLLAIIMNKY